MLGGLTPFFFSGVGGKKCHHPGFDWLLAESFSLKVGSDVIRPLDGLRKGALFFFFFGAGRFGFFKIFLGTGKVIFFFFFFLGGEVREVFLLLASFFFFVIRLCPCFGGRANGFFFFFFGGGGAGKVSSSRF